MSILCLHGSLKIVSLKATCLLPALFYCECEVCDSGYMKRTLVTWGERGTCSTHAVVIAASSNTRMELAVDGGGW